MERSCDFCEIPLTALGLKARDLLSGKLDKTKVLSSSEGFPRDYRGLAEVAGVFCNDVRNPTSSVITVWSRSEPLPTFQHLTDVLGRLDRYDVAEDVKSLLYIDALNFRLKERQVALNSQHQTASSDNDNIVTFDDAALVRLGLPPGQAYDAYLLYADQDEDIALEIVDKLENQYERRLCLKDRDIIPGAGFEHEAITYLISERCDWLIVVISPNFINSPAHKFIYNYTLALGLSERRNKIIPCIFKGNDAIKQTLYKLTYCTFSLDFTRVNNSLMNWKKLSDSVALPRLPYSNRARAIKAPVKVIESPINSTEQFPVNVPQDNLVKVENEASSSRIFDKTPIPERPPRSKNHNSSKAQSSPDYSQNSTYDVSKDSGSSSTAYLLPMPPKSRTSSITKALKNTKLVKTCKNIIKSKKKKKVAEAVVPS